MKACTFYEELETSPPRAQMALALSRVEECLKDEMLERLAWLQGTSRCEDLDTKDQKVLEEVVPLSTDKKIEFGYALGILSYSALRDLKKAVRLRNRVVHRTAALTDEEKTAVEKGVTYLRAMAMYIMEETPYLSDDRLPPPAPEYPK